jgi:hypothetical protein
LFSFLAGQAEGIDVWETRPDSGHETSSIDKFQPRLTSEERDVKFERWKEAVQRSFGWIVEPISGDESAATSTTTTVASSRIHASMGPTIFLWTSFLIWKFADWMEETS